VIRSIVRHGNLKEFRLMAINEGFSGLLEDNITEIDWKSVYGWSRIGGSMIGCQRHDAKKVGLDKIAEKFEEHKIAGLFVIGGFEAYTSIIQLTSKRNTYESFRIPMICIPCTISNNVPGTDYSVGCDTSLNEIVSMCDRVKLSAMGSRRRVFLVETMGAYCGYLAQMAGLASAADASYIFEDPFTVNDFINDVRNMKNKMLGEMKQGILIRNEMANMNYTSDFMYKLLREEGKDVFDARVNILGHWQQGGTPSVFDRNLGLKFGYLSINYFIECFKMSKKRSNYFYFIKI
jgi:6-phosphofructokinase 1